MVPAIKHSRGQSIILVYHNYVELAFWKKDRYHLQASINTQKNSSLFT